MDIKFEGLDKVLDSIEDLGNRQELKQAVTICCEQVKNTAKELAPKDTGALRRSIHRKTIDKGNVIEGIVYTPLEYAPYVEYGTGLFAEGGGGAGGYWVYVRNSDSTSSKPSKRYTLEEAKQVVAIMRSKGLDAVYTNGQHPQPFMRPALEQNKDFIMRTLKEALHD